MNEESFQLILHAGNSKSSSMEAISLARIGNFEKVQERLQEAHDEMLVAHQIQTDLLVKESRGAGFKPDILMVHAQDHLNAAMVSMEMAEEIIHLYEELHTIKKEMRGLIK